LVVGDSSLYSSGYDFLILRWNISSGSQISGYAGHTDRISCIQYGGGFVFSGSEDKTIKVWNTETRLTELSFSGKSFNSDLIF
jgi:F-box/WD-40 domain protein 7